MLRNLVRKTTIAVLALGVLAGAQFSVAAPAHAQAACGAREAVIERLSARYGEQRLGAGFQNGRGVLELFAAKSGSWTLLLTLPNGSSCIVAAGEAWREDDARQPVSDSQA